MKVSANRLLASLLIAAAPGPVWAGAAEGKSEPAFYIGAGVAANWLEGAQVPNQADDVDSYNTSYKAQFGWRVGGWLALEGQYIDFGKSEEDNNQIEATGWTANLTAGLPLTPSLIPYAKAGALFWESERRFPVAAGVGQRELDGSGTDFTWGAGVVFRFSDRIDLRAEYERFEFGDYDKDDSGSFTHVDGAIANVGSVSVLFSF